MDAVRTFGLVLFLLLEPETLANQLSENNSCNLGPIAFTKENYMIASIELKNLTSLFTNESACDNMPIAINFALGEGVIRIGDGPNPSRSPTKASLSFDWTIVFSNGTAHFDARAFPSPSANQTWMESWLSWQKTIFQNEALLTPITPAKRSLTYVLWGTRDSTQTELCFTTEMNGNKRRNKDAEKLLKARKTLQVSSMINDKGTCVLGATENSIPILDIVSEILSTKNSVFPRAPNSEKRTKKQTTTSRRFVTSTVTGGELNQSPTLSNYNAPNQTQRTTSVSTTGSENGSPPNSVTATATSATEPRSDVAGSGIQSLLIVIGIVIALVLLVLAGIYFIFCKNYRRGYVPAATRSPEAHDLTRSDAIRLKQTFL